MEVYQYVVLLHVTGSFGIFTGWGMEMAVINGFRKASGPEQLKESLRNYRAVAKLSMISMLVTLVAGVYLMITGWGQQAWIAGAIFSLLCLIVAGIYFSRKALPFLKSTSVINDQFYKNAYFDRVRYLILSIRTRIALGIAIVALMVLKPGFRGTAVILLILAFSIVAILKAHRKIIN